MQVPSINEVVTARSFEYRTNARPVITETKLRVEDIYDDYDLKLCLGKIISRFVYIEGYRELGRFIPYPKEMEAVRFNEIVEG
jgi:hypothetical protein